jgi:hypothetical protein
MEIAPQGKKSVKRLYRGAFTPKNRLHAVKKTFLMRGYDIKVS